MLFGDGVLRIPAGAFYEDIARKPVEAGKIAKARFNHGEQALAVTGQKALRLCRVEGGKLLHHQTPRLGLVLVLMCDRMNLNPLLGATNCGKPHKHRSKIPLVVLYSIYALMWRRGRRCDLNCDRVLRRNVKISMMHHNLEQYLGVCETCK